VDKAKSQPVHLLQISKKISKDGGTACKFKALVKGADGGTLSVVPPFTGHDGGAILAVNGGDTYCVHLSTDAASIIKMDSPKGFSLFYSEALDCPSLPPTTSTSSTSTSSTSSTTSSTLPHKLVFITSETFPDFGAFSSASNADYFCAAVAHLGILPGSAWGAWVSDQTTNPKTRFTHASVPYVLVNATSIPNNSA